MSRRPYVVAWAEGSERRTRPDRGPGDRLRGRRRVSARSRAARRARSIRAEVAEGVRWLWNHPLFRYMAVLTGMLNFAGQGVTLVAVVLARGQGASPAEVGAIFAAGGVGGMLGALAAPFVQRRFSFGQAIVGQIWCTAAAILLLSVATTPLLVLSALFLLNLVGPLYDTVQQSYRMASIPERLQGRVNSAFRMVAQGMGPIGLALTGVLLDRAGGAATALVCGSVQVLLALVTARNPHVQGAPPLASAALGCAVPNQR